MESLLTSSFLQSFAINPPQKIKSRKRNKPISCCLKPDPWSLSSGNPENLKNPRPKSKNPKNPLSDDNARRIIKAKAQYLSVLRRNQGSRAETPKWIKRTPEQMAQYLEDDRNGHLYGRHVVAAIKRVRSTSAFREGEYDMREVMSTFVAKLSFREMCVVLKEQKSWRQVRDFFQWMKLQLSYRPSVVAYTIVLRTYGQVGKIKLAEETFLEMLEVGCEPDEVACGTMLCSYARWGRHKAMLSFYSAIQERGIIPPTPVFNFMLSSLQKKALHSSVAYVWRQMMDNGVVPVQFTYTVVICSLVKGDMPEEAFKAFNDMKKMRLVPEEATYSLLISLRSKRGDKVEALRLYEDMRSQGIVPGNFTCASLLALYYRSGDYSKACSLFTEMEKYGVIVDEVIYGLMIRIYGKLGLYEDAQATFDEIKKSKRVNDEKTYMTMAQVHLNFGNCEKALDVMEQMKLNNIPYSRFSFIVLLQCYTVKGDVLSADVTYQALSKTGLPDATSCKQLLNLYLRLGLSEKAKDFVAQIREDRVEFDEELFKTVMKFYCKGGYLTEVKKFIEELTVKETLKNIPLVWNLLMMMNGLFSSFVEAESWCEQLEESGLLAVELILTLCLRARKEMKNENKVRLLLKTEVGESVANQLICRFTREGDMLTSEYIYQLMIELECGLYDAARASMINLYGKQKKLKQALEIFSAAESFALDLSVVYSAMIDAYIMSDREEDAYIFYQEQTKKGLNIGAVSVSMLVKALNCCGKFCEAEDIINNSFKMKAELDTVAYNTFIKAMLDAGKLRHALRIYEHMLSSNMSPSIQTYNTMISVYGRAQNLEKAVNMFNMARSISTGLDEKTYTNMICQYGKAGKVDEASALFRKMLEEGIKPGQMSYNIMMNIHAGEGLYQETEKLLEIMQKNGCSPNSQTYLAIIQAYAKKSKFSEIEETIISMQKEGISPTSAHFNLLLVALTKEGLMAEAVNIYQRLRADLTSKQTMLRGYLDFGHVDEGIEFFERECCSIKPDRFISSAAVHLYKSKGMELQAEEILNSMNALGVSFLKSLEVGSKTKTN